MSFVLSAPGYRFLYHNMRNIREEGILSRRLFRIPFLEYGRVEELKFINQRVRRTAMILVYVDLNESPTKILSPKFIENLAS